MKPVIEYGFKLYGCLSKNRLKPVFILQKLKQRRTQFKARYYPSAEFSEKSKLLIAKNYYTVELPKCFPESACSVLPTYYLN